jgi:phenylalanyl-tRNA synthetase alpha subunit
MPAPRKVFRIEETAATRLARMTRANDAAASLHEPRSDEDVQARILSELAALRAMLAPGSPSPRREASANPRIEAAHLTRIAHELNAVVSGTNEATQKILAAAEEIDQDANNLSAALKGKLEQDLAQDIRDHVIRIFEACNFQDLTGQRVSKVMTALNMIEHQIAHVIEEVRSAPGGAADAAQYLHGPRLDIDRGHVTQAEIDAIFEG